MKENDPYNQLDLLRHVEVLTDKVNQLMSSKNESFVRKYPLTFALLALFGVVAVSEGIKGILEKIGLFQNQPLFLLVVGLVILTILGSLFKKLNK